MKSIRLRMTLDTIARQVKNVILYLVTIKIVTTMKHDQNGCTW